MQQVRWVPKPPDPNGDDDERSFMFVLTTVSPGTSVVNVQMSLDVVLTVVGTMGSLDDEGDKSEM